MSSKPLWNEAQKDDIVRCQAENALLREKIHLASRNCNPKGGVDSLFDVPEVQKIHQQREQVLDYVKDNYNIQTFEQLRDKAREITQQREVNHQYEPVPNHKHPAEPRQVPPDFQQPISHHEQQQESKQQLSYEELYKHHSREHRFERNHKFTKGTS